MFKEVASFRQLLVIAGCFVLAIILGFALATPLQLSTIGIVGLAGAVLVLPLLLRWHHIALVSTWNASFIVFFLPGRPKLVFVMAFVSLAIAAFTRPLNKKQSGLHVPWVAYPLLFIGFVIVVTALLSGGFGGQSLGGDTGGAMRYLGVIGAVIGYFALISQSIPRNKALLYSTLFFLSGLTAIMSDIVYAAGPGFYFLFNFFPSELAFQQASTQDSLFRLQGLTFGALSACYLVLMRFGIAGLMEWRKWWRGLFFIVLMALSLMGGFRSAVVIIFLIFCIQCVFEGIVKRPAFLVLIACALLVGTFVILFADMLPLSIQRSLSFLPIELDPLVQMDAKSTLDWRFDMWKVLLPEVPQYLWLGKGFSFDGTDYYLTQQATLRGIYAAYEDTLISGNYHNGWLTILIPFGIWGLIGFLWFCTGGLRVLYLNYRFSDASLKRVNTFLLSFFIARLLYYSFFYGQFDLDLVLLVGVVGFSIALNGGVRASTSRTAPVNTTTPCFEHASGN